MTLLVTQGTDIFQASSDGFDFTTDKETLTIARGIVVASESDHGVFSSFANSVLINKGNILSGELRAVEFDGANSSVTNAAGASLSGLLQAVVLAGAGSQVVSNSGTIIGVEFAGIIFAPGAQSVRLNNHGVIFGGEDGVLNESPGTMNNFGTIRSATYGIRISTNTQPTSTTVITNAAAGVIKGATEAIQSDSGLFALSNFGKVIGGIFDGGNVHDVVVNHGLIKGPVHLQGGNDIFNGNGGVSGPVFGGDGNDHVLGGAHVDLLHGGDGLDMLTGRAGADRFFFDTIPNASTNVDRITDFTPAQGDKLVLSETYFTGLGPIGPLNAAHFHLNHAGPGGSPQIIYTPGNGYLYYESNINGSGAMTHFATLTTHPVIHHTDFIVEA